MSAFALLRWNEARSLCHLTPEIQFTDYLLVIYWLSLVNLLASVLSSERYHPNVVLFMVNRQSIELLTIRLSRFNSAVRFPLERSDAGLSRGHGISWWVENCKFLKWKSSANLLDDQMTKNCKMCEFIRKFWLEKLVKAWCESHKNGTESTSFSSNIISPHCGDHNI